MTEETREVKIIPMLNYAVCEINGKQYKILPNIPFSVDYLGEKGKNIELDVLLLAEDGKLHIGRPYLKEKLALKFVENIKGQKIKVSKFHAKANYRRTTGIRPKFTTLVKSA